MFAVAVIHPLIHVTGRVVWEDRYTNLGGLRKHYEGVDDSFVAWQLLEPLHLMRSPVNRIDGVCSQYLLDNILRLSSSVHSLPKTDMFVEIALVRPLVGGVNETAVLVIVRWLFPFE